MIKLTQLTKRYGSFTAVDRLDLEVPAGQLFGFLGPNGAGKTTTLRMIATMLRPTSGSIEVDGFDAAKDPAEVRRRLGFLTGTTRLYDRLTPAELVRYYADLHGIDRGTLARRRDEIFTLLDMHKFANQRIGKLSSGMKQKVSIARTIIHDPSVLVLDEATAGLDVIASRAIIHLIRDAGNRGKSSPVRKISAAGEPPEI